MTTSAETAHPVVGMVGLGTMGGAMARHLLAARYEVVGTDVAAAAAERCRKAGATVVAGAAEVAAASDVIVLSLPSVAALGAVVAELCAAPRRRATVVVETSTLPLERKLGAHEELAACSMELLDCPISGTGAQMADRDAVFYMSGDPDALAVAEPVLAACAKAVFSLGALGNGTRLKLVANHLVAVHNAAAAEALALAKSGGLDPTAALDALVAGAGTSRMLELRGPSMAAGRYEPATMTVELFMKDVAIITSFAASVGCPLPVFAAAAQLHLAAAACGWGGADTASVHAVVERLAGR